MAASCKKGIENPRPLRRPPGNPSDTTRLGGRYAHGMQFHLHYSGPLRVSARPIVKQEIRRVFHPQLREVWEHTPALERESLLKDPEGENPFSVIKRVGGFRFAPLVCDELKLVAELSILLLRPIHTGAVIDKGGDIDNRLKTLFDALRYPNATKELPPNDSPGEGEDPFFCLLDDDARIVDVRVIADRYLKAPSRDHVMMTMRVRTRPTQLIFGNVGL